MNTAYDDPELQNIVEIRYALVSARSDLRIAQDDLKHARRYARRMILRETPLLSLGSSAVEREAALNDLIEDADGCKHALSKVRQCERDSEMIQAQLESALMGIRQQEWLIRERLADAISEYATRPCVGVRDHGIGDTLVDATGEHGVFAGNRNNTYINRAERVA